MVHRDLLRADLDASIALRVRSLRSMSTLPDSKGSRASPKVLVRTAICISPTPSYGQIGRLNPPATPLSTIPCPGGAAPATPSVIVAGPDGNLWFTERRQETYRAHQPHRLPLPPARSLSSPPGRAARQKALPSVRTTISGSRRIRREYGRAHHHRGRGYRVHRPLSQCGASGIAAGPDGNIWFTENSRTRLGGSPWRPGLLHRWRPRVPPVRSPPPARR